jgi:hypothetical protein
VKFRKRPVVIEAYQTDRTMEIPTLEGTMRADPGDWIITGVQGEQYPCKPDIFEQTYEPADAEPVVWVAWAPGPLGTQIIGVFRSEEAAHRAVREATANAGTGVHGTEEPGSSLPHTPGAQASAAGEEKFVISRQPILP